MMRLAMAAAARSNPRAPPKPRARLFAIESKKVFDHAIVPAPVNIGVTS
jgi:hypothetical protein